MRFLALTRRPRIVPVLVALAGLAAACTNATDANTCVFTPSSESTQLTQELSTQLNTTANIDMDQDQVADNFAIAELCFASSAVC